MQLGIDWVYRVYRDFTVLQAQMTLKCNITCSLLWGQCIQEVWRTMRLIVPMPHTCHSGEVQESLVDRKSSSELFAISVVILINMITCLQVGIMNPWFTGLAEPFTHASSGIGNKKQVKSASYRRLMKRAMNKASLNRQSIFSISRCQTLLLNARPWRVKRLYSRHGRALRKRVRLYPNLWL